MKVSVVIPSLNCADVLEQCLVSIRKNKSKYDYEIIVVDGFSKDNTAKVAQKYADQVLIEETFYRGVNRNKGVKAAKGDIICFTDSDCIVPENWIDTLVDALLDLNQKDPKVAGVGGGNLPYIPSDASASEMAISHTVRSPLVAFGSRNMMEQCPAPIQVTHNPPMNSALFKDKILEVGGFCEENNVGEDLVLDARLTSKGYRLYAIPGCEVLHKHRSSFKKLRTQMFVFGQARVKTGRKFSSYFSWYHFGPAILALLTFSPLIFIPMSLSILNGLFVGFRNKKLSMFFYSTLITWYTHVCYGLGEIHEFIFGRSGRKLTY
ncbi:MAG: glycosyltransferase [Peptococcaceae bacterium]|nr:glycosyltransferase [Peptococcaceae bacterium]